MSSKPYQDDESHPQERRGAVDSALEAPASVKDLHKDSSTRMRDTSMMREIQEMKRGEAIHASDERTTEVGSNLGKKDLEKLRCQTNQRQSFYSRKFEEVKADSKSNDEGLLPEVPKKETLKAEEMQIELEFISSNIILCLTYEKTNQRQLMDDTFEKAYNCLIDMQWFSKKEMYEFFQSAYFLLRRSCLTNKFQLWQKLVQRIKLIVKFTQMMDPSASQFLNDQFSKGEDYDIALLFMDC